VQKFVTLAKSFSTNPLLIVVVLVCLAYFVIQPVGNYVVNDEWAHSRQVEAFTNHVFRIQANTDAVLILQALIGFGASLLFGYSFVTLKFVAIGFLLLLLVGVYAILASLRISKTLSFFTLLILAFNPIVLHLGSVFMTDIPFLALFSWVLYFYIRYFKSNKFLFAVLGGILCALSILIRQVGVMVFAAFFVVECARILRTIGEKITLKGLLIKFLPLVISGLIVCGGLGIYLLWPRYSSFLPGGKFGGMSSFLSNFILFDKVFPRVGDLLTSLYYFGFFSFPLVFALKTNLKKWTLVVIILVGGMISYFMYKSNVFPLGNILYLEGLYAKALQLRDVSLFNNFTFKFIVSLLSGFSITKIALILFFEFKRSTQKLLLKLFLLMVFVLTLLLLVFTNDLYDRYLLPSYLAFLLLVALVANSTTRISKVIGILFGCFFMLISVLLVFDYTVSTKLKWDAAKAITQNTGIYAQILVDNAYSSYQTTKKFKDYSGLDYINSSNNYLCVTEVIRSDVNGLVGTDLTKPVLINKLDSIVSNLVGDPKEIKKKKSPAPVVEKEDRDYYFSKDYYSPVYKAVNLDTNVQGWCMKPILRDSLK